MNILKGMPVIYYPYFLLYLYAIYVYTLESILKKSKDVSPVAIEAIWGYPRYKSLLCIFFHRLFLKFIYVIFLFAIVNLKVLH